MGTWPWVSVAGGIAREYFGIAGRNEGVIRGIFDRAIGGGADAESCTRLRMNTAVTSIRRDPATQKYAVRTETASDPAPGA